MRIVLVSGEWQGEVLGFGVFRPWMSITTATVRVQVSQLVSRSQLPQPLR